MRSWLARLGAVAAVCAAGACVAPAAAVASALSVHAKPALSPGFAAGISDYVSRCEQGKPLELKIDAPSGTTVGVHGSKPSSGKFTASVALRWGEDADVVSRSKAGKRRYHVRCVPPDFPRWTFKRSARPGARWYLFAPVTVPDTLSGPSHYVVIIDGHGTPVWWKRESPVPFNSLLLQNGELAWGRWYSVPFGMRASGGWEVHRLDGSVVRTLRTHGSPTDMHDMEPLPNGDYLLLTYHLRKGVDLRPFDGPGNGAVLDGEIQRVTPAGTVVWTWSSKDHIRLSEDIRWRWAYQTLPDGTNAWDYFHLNSVEPDGDGLVISARHVDAIYRISRTTGDVLWKLGGTTRGDGTSLTVRGDHLPEPFIGQHDARELPDGTLTAFDNHTYWAHPRAVRFRIDPAARTATELDSVMEPSADVSPAEGSARRLPGGHWVVSWGGTRLISERTATDEPVWLLTLKHAQNYRLTPILSGQLKVTAVRHAMDRVSAGRGAG